VRQIKPVEMTRKKKNRTPIGSGLNKDFNKNACEKQKIKAESKKYEELNKNIIEEISSSKHETELNSIKTKNKEEILNIESKVNEFTKIVESLTIKVEQLTNKNSVLSTKVLEQDFKQKEDFASLEKENKKKTNFLEERVEQLNSQNTVLTEKVFVKQ